MAENEGKELILVCGVDGSGRNTFLTSFKNSFMASLPNLPLYQGLIGGLSFCSTSSLIDEKHLTYIRLAHEQGYKITLYYIFCGKILGLARNRLRVLAQGIAFDETLFRKTYDASYKGLVEVYPYTDLVFFIKNQKEFEFMVAYEPSSTPQEVFKNAVKKAKTIVDHLK